MTKYKRFVKIEVVMYLIVGLGNYGAKYNMTRHNIGFEVVDKFAYDHKIDISKKKHKGLIGEGVVCGKKVIVVKPQTYMNLSGECVSEVMKFYKIPLENLVVIYDDYQIDIGKIMMKPKGSAGGQNGIKNIIQHLGTEEIQRIKVGIGNKPPKMVLADYVLSKFLKEEIPYFEDGVTRATEAIETFLQENFEKSMTKHNKK